MAVRQRATQVTRSAGNPSVTEICSRSRFVGVAETGQMGQDHVVWKLYLAPEFRGRALGRALLRHAIAPLHTKTDHVLVEHFAENTRAARFYEREG